MPEYLVDVRTNLHPEDIEAYVARVKASLGELATRATAAGGVSSDLRSEAQVVQSRAYGTEIASKDTLGVEGAAKLRAALDLLFSKETAEVKKLTDLWTGRGGVLLNQQQLDVTSKRSVDQAQAGADTGPAEAQAAADREAARLTEQRVGQEAIRLEAAERGIVFAEESSAAEREAAVKVARRAEVENVRALQAELALDEDRGVVEGVARQKLAQKQLNEAVAARIRQMEKEQAEEAGNGPANASLFQKAQAYFFNRNRPEARQRDESSFDTGGQFISQRLFQGGAYAIAGTALYSMVGNVKALVQEGTAAQVMFDQLRAQLDDVGKSNKFPEIRDDVLSMAKASGIAVDQVGALASTMLGAFQNPQEAMQATNAGLALMQVSGLQLADVQNNLVAIMRTFGITGAEAMVKVDDQVNHLKDTFGVSQKEIVDGVGNIAPLAQEMGLSFRDASTLIAGASAVSGRSATQTANEIGRALTQIEKQFPVISNVLNTPASSGLLSSITGDIGAGKQGQVIIDLVRHWKELTKGQQESILTAIGGRREFASLAAALGENQKIIAALDDTSDHEGTTAARLAEYHRSLSYQLKTAGEAFRQLGVAIINSPIGQALALLVRGGGDVARWLGDFLGLLGRLNADLGGIPGRVIALTGAWLILKNVLSLDHLSKALGLLKQIGQTQAGKLTGKTADTQAATHGAAIEESGNAAGAAMRTGIVTGGDAAAAAMATALREAGVGWALQTRTVTTEEIAEINTTLATTFSAGAAELAAAEEAAIAELAAELSALSQELTAEELAALGEALAGLQAAMAAGGAQAAALIRTAMVEGGAAAGGENAAGNAAGWALKAAPSVGSTVGADLAETAAAGGAAGKLATGLGATLGPLASFAGLLEAALPILAVVGGYKIGNALKGPVEDATSPRGPDDIVLRRKLFSNELTKDTKKQLTDYYNEVFKRQTEAGKGADIKKLADQSLPDRSLLEKVTLTPNANTAKNRVQVQAAKAFEGAQLGKNGNQQYNQDIINALEASGNISGDQAAQLAEGISKNDYDTYRKVTALYNKRKTGHPQFTAALAQARTEAPVVTGDAVKTAQQLQKDFEAGNITFDQLQEGLRKQLAIYQEMAAKAGGEQNLPQQYQDQMNQLGDQIDKNDIDRVTKMTQAQDTREQADAARKGRPEQIAAALAKAQRDALDAQKHDDPAKEAQAYAEQQKAEQDAVDYQSALRKSKIDIQKAQAQSNYDPVAAAQADLDLAQEDYNVAKDDAAKQEATAQIIQRKLALQQAKDQADATRRQGHAALLKAQAAGRYDPVAGALADLQAAEGDLAANRDPAQDEALRAKVVDARNSYNQTLVDQAHALGQLRQEQDAGNAQQVAADAIAQASDDVNRIVAAGGYGSQAWADAQRALIAAQRQAVDAALATTNSVLDYDEAVANAAGDTVRAANDEYQKALNAYNTAVQKGDTDTARSLQAELVTKAASVRDANIKTSEDNIQFQLQMRQISNQQAIAQYEGLLQLAQGNQQLTQEILLKIDDLRKTAASDLQFDIPSDINLNGLLYQSRRLDQQSAAGHGYQDNRNIQVQYNVYGPMDHQQTMNDLSDALDGSPRVGVSPRTYP